MVKELCSPKAGGKHPFLSVVPSDDKFTHVMTLLVLPTSTRVLIPGIAALGSTCCVWGGEPAFHSTAFETTIYLAFFTFLSVLLASLSGRGIGHLWMLLKGHCHTVLASL